MTLSGHYVDVLRRIAVVSILRGKETQSPFITVQVNESRVWRLHCHDLIPRLKSRKIFEYQSWAKPLAILSRGNESLYHFGIDKVASELIQFRQPEVVAGEVVVWRVVRVPAQVTEVLHQYEGAVEFLLGQCRVLRHTSQGARARRDVGSIRS
jgi:hypothetical protein